MSGVFVLARSEYNELLDMAADGRVNRIIVDIPDRLGRGDAIAKLELMAELNGARIEYVTPGRDTSTIEGYATHSTDQLVSGIERLNIRRRTMNGRRAIVKSGQILNFSRRPYGYDIVCEYDQKGKRTASRMVINESEAQIVRQIFEWYVYDGLTTYGIAEWLTKMGVPKPRSRNNIGWSRTSVLGFLKNETYAGTWHYAKTQFTYHDTQDGVRTTSKLRDKAEWIPVSVPAIISREVFNEAQKQIAEHRKRGNKPTKHQYLLRSRVRCALCGSMMFGGADNRVRKDGTIWRCYRCRRSFPDYHGDRCPCHSLNAELAESTVWRYIHDILLSDELLFVGIDARRQEAEKAHRNIQAAIAAIEAQNKKSADKLSRLLDTLLNGDIDKPTFHIKKREIEADVNRRALEIQEYQRQLSEHIVITPEQESELKAYIAKLAKGLDGATFEDKRKYLEWLKVKCIYNYRTQELTITGLIGTCTLNIYSQSRAPAAR